MKVLVRLAILVAALLLVTNLAFANGCPIEEKLCYDIIGTDENDNTNSDSWEVCLYDDGTGLLYSDKTGLYNLYLFGGGPGWFNTNGYPGFVNGDPKWATWIAHAENDSGFLQPIGEGGSKGDLLVGEGVRDGIRYTVQGRKVPCEIVVSDERYKKEIQPLGSSLDNVMQLRGVSYSWKTEEYKGMGFKEGREIGLIAQEVEKVYPELVTTDGKGYKAVFYSKLVPVLIEAVKEQQQEIKEKDVRIERLERALEIMEKRIAAIESPTRTSLLK